MLSPAIAFFPPVIIVYNDNMLNNDFPASASYNDDSCIAAIATAPGQSALAIVRTSGKICIELLAKIFSAPKKLLAAKGNTIVYGWIKSGDTKIDEVLISVYRNPHSLTGEDAADINCHGGSAAPQAVLKLLIQSGFRAALPGEFSLRAFINGKIDLTKAESVMEIVSAKTDAARGRSVSRLSGVLYDKINTIKNAVLSVLTEIEILLDYSELDGVGSEDDSCLNSDQQKRLHGAAISLLSLLESYKTEKIYRDGVLVVIAGRPNAGKSSLFNLLLKEERSIVTEIAGTTRDWIDDFISIDGIPIRLADTAGLHEANGEVEKIGIERSLNLTQKADLILYVIDSTKGICAEDKQFLESSKELQKKILLIKNKSDLIDAPSSSSICISAKTGQGLNDLHNKIKEFILSSVEEQASEKISLGTDRQKYLVEIAHNSIVEALNANDCPLDLIAPIIRQAINALGEITGEVSTADILEAMFSKFCVGK
jgi:tRNA modification GTPase